MARNGAQTVDSRLIEALLAGGTVRDAARQAGIGERTAWRKLADPGFQAALETARTRDLGGTHSTEEMTDAVLARLGERSWRSSKAS